MATDCLQAAFEPVEISEVSAGGTARLACRGLQFGLKASLKSVGLTSGHKLTEDLGVPMHREKAAEGSGPRHSYLGVKLTDSSEYSLHGLAAEGNSDPSSPPTASWACQGSGGLLCGAFLLD